MIGIPQNKNPDPHNEFEGMTMLLGFLIFVVFAIMSMVVEYAVEHKSWEGIIRFVLVVAAIAFSWWLARFILGRKRND